MDSIELWLVIQTLVVALILGFLAGRIFEKVKVEKSLHRRMAECRLLHVDQVSAYLRGVAEQLLNRAERGDEVPGAQLDYAANCLFCEAEQFESPRCLATGEPLQGHPATRFRGNA